MRYWTADMHLGHYSKNGGIIAYCERPFRDLTHMNARLVADANMRVNPDDDVIHVGDFCVRTRTEKARWWRDQLNGHWTFTKGNHDPNNGVKTVCNYMFVRISHFMVFVGHLPYYYEAYENDDLAGFVEAHCDFAVCGHVHEKWRTNTNMGIPVINVGVDVQKYRPVRDDELVQQYLEVK